MLWQNLRVLVKIIPQLFLKRHSKSALLLKYFFFNPPYVTTSQITGGLPYQHVSHKKEENCSEENSNISMDFESSK